MLIIGALTSDFVIEDAEYFFDEILQRRLRQTAQRVGFCLALRNAISGIAFYDLDGYFLKVVRNKTELRIPILCSLNCQVAVIKQMVDMVITFVAYYTDPQVDLVEKGMRAAKILLDTPQGKMNPRILYRKITLLLPCPYNGMHAIRSRIGTKHLFFG